MKRLFKGKRDFWREYDFNEEEERRQAASRDEGSEQSSEGMEGVLCEESTLGTTTRTVSPTEGEWEMPELSREATISKKGDGTEIVAEVERAHTKKEKDEGVGRFGFVKGPVRNPVQGWRRE